MAFEYNINDGEIIKNLNNSFMQKNINVSINKDTIDKIITGSFECYISKKTESEITYASILDDNPDRVLIPTKSGTIAVTPLLFTPRSFTRLVAEFAITINTPNIFALFLFMHDFFNAIHTYLSYNDELLLSIMCDQTARNRKINNNDIYVLVESYVNKYDLYSLSKKQVYDSIKHLLSLKIIDEIDGYYVVKQTCKIDRLKAY